MGSRYTYVCITAAGELQSADLHPMLAMEGLGIARARTETCVTTTYVVVS